MKRTLVPDSATVPSVEDLDLPGMEPVFWEGRDHALHVPDWYPVGPMIEHLAYRVARTPTDLAAHTRRFLLCVRAGVPAPVLGSLADLFIALGSRGTDLRTRFYALALQVLPAAMLDQAHRWLAQGFVDEEALPDDTHAVLVARPSGRPLTLPDR
jgi:hypothetical protein